MKYPPLDSELQVAFFYRLKAIRDVYLGDALRRTVSEIPTSVLNKELEKYISHEVLQRVTTYGIRGEVIFAVPVLLQKNPRLLGYYRLLYGLSQKEFYTKGPFGRFKRMEESKDMPKTLPSDIDELCQSLSITGENLIMQLDELDASIIHDLQLLTLGPQFRGSRNTELGKAATQKAFSLIKEIVEKYILSSTDSVIIIRNDSDRDVRIEFSNDPDIIIVETVRKSKNYIVSVEIKGGTDYSNVHNRLGEAEKSHQKAKAHGFFEFWTILAIDVDLDVARSESPTTSHFFNLSKLYDLESEERERFVDILSSKLSIKSD